MKKFLRLACGFGVLAGSFALVGCESGSSDDGLPNTVEVNKAGADAMKNMPKMGLPAKGKGGTLQNAAPGPAAAPAPAEVK